MHPLRGRRGRCHSVHRPRSSGESPREVPQRPRMWCKRSGRTPRMSTTPTIAMMKREGVEVPGSFNRRPRRGALLHVVLARSPRAATPSHASMWFSHVAHAFPTSPPLPMRRSCPHNHASLSHNHVSLSPFVTLVRPSHLHGVTRREEDVEAHRGVDAGPSQQALHECGMSVGWV